MSFRMVCPKCETRDYSITRDIRTSTAKDPVTGLIFSCRCGKQIFGQNVLDEHEAQERAFEASAADRTRKVQERQRAIDEEQQARHRLRQAYEYRREYVARKRAEEAEAERARKAEQDRAWRERVSTGEEEEGEQGLELGAGGFERCAWKDCGKPRRPRSKYCSRECSNKNARHRHKQRKRSPKDETAAA